MKYQGEIKKILRGYSTRIQGYYAAAEGLSDIAFFGNYNGTEMLRLRGLFCLERQYLIPGKLPPALEKCTQQMYRIGHPAILRENSEAVCCLRMRAMGNPVFLVLENKAKVLNLYVYTARNIWARLICKKTIELFEADLTDTITPSGNASEVKKTETRKGDRAAKKAAKQARKQEIAERKQEIKQRKQELKKRKQDFKMDIKEQKQESKEREEELRIIREIKREQRREELFSTVIPQAATRVPTIEGLDGDDAELDIEEYMEHYVQENH